MRQHLGRTVLIFFCVIILSVVVNSETSLQVTNYANAGNILRPQPMYMAVLPRLVRPNQPLSVYMTLFRLTGRSVEVVLTLRRQHLSDQLGAEQQYTEQASVTHRFIQPGSKLLQMKVREDAESGNYSIRMEGRSGDGSSGILFVNETNLVFHAKQVSCFIQTDRSVIRANYWVRFRVICFTPNQLPVKTGSITIYIKDGRSRIVQRFVAQNLFKGIYEDRFRTIHPNTNGWWTIEVHGWGYVYTQKVRVEPHWPELFYTNISMPSFVKEGEYALAGLISANLTYGKCIEGNATVYLEVQPPSDSRRVAILKQNYRHFKCREAFLFPLEPVRNYTDKLVGTQLHVTASVVDHFFGEVRTWSNTAVIYSNKVRLTFLGGHVRVFKPSVPFDINVAVYEPDGSKLSRQYRRTVTIDIVSIMDDGPSVTSEPQVTIVPDSSIVSHTIIPTPGAKRIMIRAYYSDEKNTLIEMIASRHYTKSEKYLTVTSSTINPQVDRYMVFTAKVSVIQTELNYMVVAKGGVLLADTIRMTSRQKTFSVALSRDMVPQARMLVYCLLPDGEVLADSINFHVDGMKSTNVCHHWYDYIFKGERVPRELPVVANKGKDFSGKSIELTVKTYPGTFIAFSAMDYYLYSRGGQRDKDANIFFTKNAVEEDLATYDPLSNHSFSHEWLLDEGRRELVYRNSPSHGIDANMTFSYAGVVVFTDALIPRIPAIWTCNDTLGFHPCFNGGCFRKDQWCDGVRHCVDGADEMGCPNPQVVPSVRRNDVMDVQRIWTYLEPSDWAWGNYYTKPQGNLEVKVKMPVRANTWLIGAFGLSHIHGLVFTHEPARVDTAKAFYMTVDVIPNVAWGEQLGIRVVLFNYWDQHIESLLTLPASDQYRFIHVEDYGITSSYKPKTSKSEVQTMVYISPGTQTMIFFPILPIVLGKVKVTITAESPINREVITKTFTVRMNGVTNVYHTPYLINLVSKGSIIIPNLEIEIPERFYDPEERQRLYVPGSGKATVTLVGDVMGPGIMPPCLTQQKITERFEGAGQDFVFNFALNLYWLQFLRTTNHLTQKILDDALICMITQLKNMSPFIQKDNGLAIRRASNSLSSVWLSAFFVQTMSAGSDPEWENTLYVDVDIINKMTMFIISQQDPATGAFMWHNTFEIDLTLRNMLFNESGVPRNISLTAYTAIALAKSINVLTGDAKSAANEAKELAGEYLSKHLDIIEDPFQICLVTYALYVTDNRAKGVAFQKMVNVSRRDNYVYWSDRPIPQDRVRIINTVPYQFPRPLPRIGDLRALQATSYALLVYLRTNRFEEAEPIMEWIQKQRYSDHAYSGPQATIIALQALKEYGERITNRDLYRLRVTLEATADPSWKKEIWLDKGNFQNYVKIPVNTKRTYGGIRATAQGTGLALLQLRTEVNVEYDFQLRSQMRPDDQRSFDLEMDKILFYGRNGSHILYNVCFRWTRPDISPHSGSSVLEIELPSGYWSTKRHLVGRVKAHKYPNVRRPRSVWRRAFFYLDYVTTERQCLEFTAIRWLPVANATIQHFISIYDTYNPAFQNKTIYTAYTLFHNHICQVCGSFQCPYCPYYNQAASLQYCTVKVTLLLFTVLISVSSNVFSRSIT